MINKLIWLLKISLFYIANLTSTALCFIIAVFLCIIPTSYNIKFKILSTWSRFFISSAKLILGLNYRVFGAENIPKDPCVIMSNHQSTWDAIVMQVIMPTQCWVLKKELLNVPLFGVMLRAIKPIAVDRKDKNSVKQLILQGKKRIAEGVFVIIFPEGTRVNIDRYKPYSRSGAALAIEAKSLILPIAHNAGAFWPRGPIPKKAGTIDIIIGSPINSENKDPSVLTKEVEEWINHKRKSLDTAQES